MLETCDFRSFFTQPPGGASPPPGGGERTVHHHPAEQTMTGAEDGGGGGGLDSVGLRELSAVVDDILGNSSYSSSSTRRSAPAHSLHFTDDDHTIWGRTSPKTSPFPSPFHSTCRSAGHVAQDTYSFFPATDTAGMGSSHDSPPSYSHFSFPFDTSAQSPPSFSPTKLLTPAAGSGGSGSPVHSEPGRAGGRGQPPGEPDKDAIKMFVGQIPKSWDEADLKAYFEKFGRLHQLNILKDKITNESKGCGFVTYFTRDSAIEAQRILHDKVVLPGMAHCIQMKPADSENRKERKLFIGMLPKKMGEAEVRAAFGKFGPIEECTVLKNADNSSKGCAFVTFLKKADANTAIRAMNGHVLEGNRGVQLVVKNADSQKDKESRRLQTQQQHAALNYLINPYNSSYLNLMNSASPLPINGLAGSLVSQSPPGSSSGGGSHSADSSLSQQSAAAAAMLNAGLGSPVASPGSSQQQQQQAAAMAFLSQTTAQQQQQQQQQQQLSAQQLSSILDATGAFGGGSVSTAHAAAFSLLNSAAGTNLGLGSPSLFATPSPTAPPPPGTSGGCGSPRRHDKQREGPEGSNLFIYHLPADYTDADLRETFLPFGNVISAKVFIDKNTNLSKCFGFVSYDNPSVAQLAIKAMDGYQVGNKKLKVEHKKVKKPAAAPTGPAPTNGNPGLLGSLGGGQPGGYHPLGSPGGGGSSPLSALYGGGGFREPAGGGDCSPWITS